MNHNQIEFIRSLDKEQSNGTIQNILLGNLGPLETARFESVLQHLVHTLKGERDLLEKENAIMRKALVENNLYTSKLMGLE